MQLEVWKDFFAWCAAINFGVLLFTAIAFLAGGGTVYRVHTRWFPMPKETFNVVVYSMLGLFKLCWFFFNVVPYFALRIVIARAMGS